MELELSEVEELLTALSLFTGPAAPGGGGLRVPAQPVTPASFLPPPTSLLSPAHHLRFGQSEQQQGTERGPGSR